MKVSCLDMFLKNIKKSKKDLIYKYQSIWPIYNLCTTTEDGLWEIFENKILNLSEKNLLEDVTEEEFQKFFDENTNIEFELIFFEKTLPELFFLKINNKIYCYTTSRMGKKLKKYIDVRFYFDVQDFLKI